MTQAHPQAERERERERERYQKVAEEGRERVKCILERLLLLSMRIFIEREPKRLLRDPTKLSTSQDGLQRILVSLVFYSLVLSSNSNPLVRIGERVSDKSTTSIITPTRFYCGFGSTHQVKEILCIGQTWQTIF